MRLIYIHQYFKTPAEGGPIRSYYLAKGLVDNGFEVDLITAHNQKQAIIKNVDGIKVHYLPISYDNAFGFKRRMLSYSRFMYKAADEAMRIKDADLCYATSTPLTIGLAAMKIKKRLNIPFFFEVRDLWPEAPLQMGALKNPWIRDYAVRLEHKIYQHAEKIIALSPGIADDIRRRQNGKEIRMIPNMSDVDFFRPEKKDKDLVEKFGAGSDLVVSYFGAIGKANHLEFLLDSAESCQNNALPVKFFVVGNGSEKERLDLMSKERRLDNIRFLPFMNKGELRELLNITDAAYISFANKPVMGTNSPNKFFDALASGKLVITNTNGWVRDLSEMHECGFYTNPTEPREFVNQIKPFIEEKDRLDTFQKNARKLGEEKFSRKQQVQELITALTA